ncbi:LamG domain-containing protein [Candidatus Poribacteria bacterium]
MKLLIFLSLFCFVVFTFQIYADDPDLVVYLPMDSIDGDQVADASANGLDGTLVADAELIDGKHGKALEISAAGEIQILDDEGLDGMQAMTVAIWVWQDSHHATGIIQKGGDWGNKSYLIQPWSDQQIYFGILDTTSRAITKPGDYPLSEWYHMAGTFDGENLTIYINGEEKASAQAPTDTVPDTVEPLQVGNRLVGALDDFVMYSRVLTADEIRGIMDGNILPVEISGKLATTWASIKSEK